GIGLPVVLGCTFTAVAPMILVGNTHGISVLYGSIFLSGIIVIIMSPFFSYLVKLFPPVVTGSVVTIIGITLMPVAMNYLAGGEGEKNYGDSKNIFLGVFTLVIILLIQRLSKGFIKSIAILLGLLIGDRKSTRLNSSNVSISYAVFCSDVMYIATHFFPTRRSSDLDYRNNTYACCNELLSWRGRRKKLWR